jgi:hypothetical protein
MDYPNRERDEHRRAVGEGLLKHLVQRGVVDPPLEPSGDPEGEPSGDLEGPSVRAKMELAKEQHQAYIALLAIGAMEQAQANGDREGQ